MKDAVWYLLITAIAIPVGGWIVTHLSARISQGTARDTALLAAAQRRRDAEIAQLRDAQNDLLEAAAAVESFAWYVDQETRLRTTISKEEWNENREFFQRAVVASGRLRAIAPSMPTDELHERYIAVQQLILEVVSGNAEQRDAWAEDLEKQPDTITRAINATAQRIKLLYDTYPCELPSSQPRPAGWYYDPFQPWAQRYWDGAEWTDHTAPLIG